jgi:hypothetical protein
VGGVYRDQGLDALSRWIIPLFRSRVEAAYQTVRKEYLLPPTTSVLPRPVAPTAHQPTPDPSLILPSRPNRTRRRSSSPREEGSANAGKQGDERFHRGHHIDIIVDVHRAVPHSRCAEGSSTASPDKTENVRKRLRLSGLGGL